MEQSYDYVIVGAGSSGAVLAARLTEDPGTTVLLLEAGPDYRATEAPPEMRSANPRGIFVSDRFPAFHWPKLLARRTGIQQPFVYDRGRGLGGSSAINWMVAFRAELDDFDGWAAQGCAGWSGEELLPAMNRLETDLDFGDAPYHGNAGPITIQRVPVPRWGKVGLALLHAGLDLGYPWHPDLNAPESTGISPVPTNHTGDSRVSTNDGYLEPARGRPNLTIRGDTHVDRVLFDGRRAVGVRAHGPAGVADYAGREIILSAGPVFSPPILVRSGIGPADDVTGLGIALLRDLPVGRNVRDHPVVGLRLELRPEARVTTRDDRNITCNIRYSSRLGGTGVNDMLIGGSDLAGFDEVGLGIGYISAVGWQTFSEGVLRVVDPDPFAMPEIDEHLLSDDRDIIRMRDGARRIFAIGRHPAVQAIATAIELDMLDIDTPVPTQLTMDDVVDDRALDAWLLAHVRDTWHIVGTCRMGAPDDPRSVVDPDCRVLGVENLRVIDGSIMPDVTRANTNLPIMTIAEHMAARLRRGSTRKPAQVGSF